MLGNSSVNHNTPIISDIIHEIIMVLLFDEEDEPITHISIII